MPPIRSASRFASTSVSRFTAPLMLERVAVILGRPGPRRLVRRPAFFPFFEYFTADARLTEILMPCFFSAAATATGLAAGFFAR